MRSVHQGNVGRDSRNLALIALIAKHTSYLLYFAGLLLHPGRWSLAGHPHLHVVGLFYQQCKGAGVYNFNITSFNPDPLVVGVWREKYNIIIKVWSKKKCENSLESKC